VEEIVSATIKNLSQNNIAGYYVQDVKQLIETVHSLLSDGETIGCGDSVTLEETKVFDFIRKGNYIFLDKHNPELTSTDKREIYLQNFRAHTFLSGVNAVTRDGGLYFIDGNGSRVAPIIYGPEQVILVAGTNKIVSDSEEAIRRIRQTAAPLDAKRLGKNTPCVKLGRCVNCKSKERICNDFVCITRQFVKDRIKVIFLEGDFGY
jgi:L-lactate utilization protein LutB